MLIWLSIALALASLGVSGAAISLVLRRPEPLPQPASRPALPEPRPSPLEGLKVTVAIKQDHALPVFANILSETLQKLDAEVISIPFEDLPTFRQKWVEHSDSSDLLIFGSVTCNGYAEIYYQADLTCCTPSETICALLDSPVSGDRPSNLASELVSRIEKEITKRLSRSERRLALRELQGG